MEPFTRPNLYWFDIYPKRNGATKISLEYNRKIYQIAGEFNTGKISTNVFIKIIRQYFAKRTAETNTVFFDNIPIYSLEDLQNINITFEFFIENDKLGFCYLIRNTDTNIMIAEDKRENVPLESYYKREINLNECNLCNESDYIFVETDFD